MNRSVDRITRFVFMFDDLYSEYNFLTMLQELKSARLSILEGRVVLVLEYQALGTIGLHVRVRVNSICRAGHDRVRVSSQDVVET